MRRLQLDLAAKPQTISIGDRPANLLTYNGQLSGPLLEAKPGDTVQLNFTNQLAQPTNIHFHGLHIPPTGSGDDVFLEILPGEQHTYDFQIPLDDIPAIKAASESFLVLKDFALVQLGTVEDWEIINTGTMAHPFHVHVNKFQIISRNGQPVPYAAWKDVISVSPGERVKLRMALRDYTGKTVYHCHVLDHEDLGMMGTLEILAET